MATFQDFKLQEYCNQVIKELGFKKPTPIQEKVIPLVLKNRDIIGISQTGTGKSHAFLLPIMSRIDVNKDCVQAVITAPTRELASQLFNNAKTFTKYLPELRVSLIVGGSDRQRAVNKLSIQPHVVIGTPGRIKDLSLDAQALQITTAKTFVVDEADMTLEFGYLEDIDAVAGKMKDDLKMMVFSATIPQMLRPFLKKYMKTPVTIEIDDDKVTTDNVEHILIATKHQDRYDVLKKINQKEDFVLYIGRSDCKDCQEFEPYLKKYLKKNKGVYLYYFNIKEYRDQANSQEATKKEKSRYNQMRKKLDFSWTPTLKLVINGKFVDQYTFLDEDYYSLPSKKQKEKKQDYIDKLSSWLDQIYQD